ncbi:metalloregulator ArsR/SmtB family transcription factor [Saccharibacillus sacchari]|uniref:Metalloregulator ArsR/SmtB family transcription factor n=1 Tax=Saccharibacillus sacchari TaxID=456493 RepID=A0ACC6PH32_9BACL
MQLEKLVAYHKALADPTRIRILILLSEGELNGQALAQRLSVTPATITHHATKLRAASLIRERRDKNTIYFSLDDYFIRTSGAATADLIYRRGTERKAAEADPAVAEQQEKTRNSVLKSFVQADGRLKSIPAQLKKKLIVLEEMVKRLEPGRKYGEKEINEFIKTFHEDFATLRREFIMHQYMFREDGIYELNPPELWERWETLK